MRRKLRRFLRNLAFPPAPPIEDVSQPSVFQRLKMRAIPIKTVIDVGASNGHWSAEMMEVYPAAKYLCVEALAIHEPALKEFAACRANVDYVIAAAGDRQGQVNFYAPPDDPFGGAASEKPFPSDNRLVPMTSIDRLCESKLFPPPYLLKLDTHGFELPILHGASQTLGQTNLLIVETYNFRYRAGMLLFYEMCQHLAEKGFRCFDIMRPVHRPGDQVLWQVDIVFARATLPEFQSNAYA